nr:ATPase F0 subunit 8 [Indopinnixa haematosticta]
MPQMAPLYWLYLFCFFLSMLLTFMILNYFLPPYNKTNISHLESSSKHKSWKL